MKANIQSIYAKIWDQCIEALQNMIQYLKYVDNNEKAKQIQWLLEEVKNHYWH